MKVMYVVVDKAAKMVAWFTSRRSADEYAAAKSAFPGELQVQQMELR